MRYRYEFVDQKNLHNANASTLRTKLGYKTGSFNGLNALLEFENILEVGERRYNDTIHTDKTSYATVADPKVTQLNQAYLNWESPTKTNLRAGRQIINFDNQRFIGSAGWRQNDQTFDAIKISNDYFQNLDMTYVFIEKVNRIFGNNSTIGTYNNNNINIINVSYDGFNIGKITGYDYFLDIKDAPSSSSKTSGLRLSGDYDLEKSTKALYLLEFARQNEYGNNTTNYTADYVFVEAGVNHKNFTLKTGYEELGSDGLASFQTPLATGHKFNGWADKFLNTPIEGLRDFYGTLEYQVKSNNILNNIITSFTFHDFHSDKTRVHYGEEYDFLVKKKFHKHYDAGVKVAFYKNDENSATYNSVDTTKIMAFTGLQF